MATALLHNRVINTGGGLPDFTYSGEHALVEEDGGWKIRFLTSGTMRLANKATVDIFIVGGGGGGSRTSYTGGGGGGGYTTTIRRAKLASGTDYSITVGAGGAVGTNGGQSSFTNDYTADGGKASGSHVGGDGGSGGGGSAGTENNGKAGHGGSDGSNGNNGVYKGGTGQGVTTREFGEETGELYSGGGGGGARYNVQTPGSGGAGGGGKGGTGTTNASAGARNTGGGGGGASNAFSSYAAAGGSGIVIIRNAR